VRRSSTRFGLVPTPQPDETLTSFLLRLAFNHGATAHEFFALEWPSVEFWTRDLDRTVGDPLLQSVARATGISIDRMESMTLRNLAPEACQEPRGLHNHAGLLPVGIYHRTRRGNGQQFCPLCLAQDPAYLRRVWRLSLVVACPIHGCRLRDACPVCDAPFIPHRQHALMRRTCHACTANLIGGTFAEANQSAFRLQTELTEELTSTNIPPGPGKFQRRLLAGVLILLRIALRLESVAPDGSKIKFRTWNRLRTIQREQRMAVAEEWVRTWPNMWSDWATERRVTQVRIRQYGPLPTWIAAGSSTLPFNLGPLGPRPRKRTAPWRRLRRSSSDQAAYRTARATHLLDQATRLQIRRNDERD
jgi:hypothetical protein